MTWIKTFYDALINSDSVSYFDIEQKGMAKDGYQLNAFLMTGKTVCLFEGTAEDCNAALSYLEEGLMTERFAVSIPALFDVENLEEEE